MLAKEVVEAAGPSGRIACIACPSLFRQLRAAHPEASAHLFEVDPRFEVMDCPLPEAILRIMHDRAPTGRAPFGSSRSLAWLGRALQTSVSAWLPECPCPLSCLSMLT